MNKLYTIPGFISVRISAHGTVNSCEAVARFERATRDDDGKFLVRDAEVCSLTRPSGCEEQAIQDVADQLDAEFGRSGELS